VTKLFGFFKGRGDQPARLVRVEAPRHMSRDELRTKLVAISARKSRVQTALRGARDTAQDEQPPSRGRVEWNQSLPLQAAG